MSDSVSDPLGRPPRFKPRSHKLGGLGLDERKLTAIGGDEHIDLRTIPKGDGACAIRLDGVRGGDALVTSNLPVKVRGSDAFLLTVAVKHSIPCNGERDLVIITLDYNPIKGEQIRAVKRGLRALPRPSVPVVVGIYRPSRQDTQHEGGYGRHHDDALHAQPPLPGAG